MPYVQCILNVCSVCFPCMLPVFSLYDPCVFPVCSLCFPYMIPVFSLCAPIKHFFIPKSTKNESCSKLCKTNVGRMNFVLRAPCGLHVFSLCFPCMISVCSLYDPCVFPVCSHKALFHTKKHKKQKLLKIMQNGCG